MAILLTNIETLVPNIAVKLLDSQDLLKCLFYNTRDALSKTNLTDNQKYNLINQDILVDTRIFFSPSPTITITEEQTQLRIFMSSFSPDNLYLGKAVFDFQIIVHENLWLLNNTKQRPIVIIQEILKKLNDISVSGLGNLRLTNPIKIVKFADNFTGYMMSLQNWSD